MRVSRLGSKGIEKSSPEVRDTGENALETAICLKASTLENQGKNQQAKLFIPAHGHPTSQHFGRKIARASVREAFDSWSSQFERRVGTRFRNPRF